MLTRRNLVKATMAAEALIVGDQQNKASESRQFFAWARPINVPGVPVDHTWVTTYDNRINVFKDISKVTTAE
jgi:hypothetical protein